ncbi:DUF1697 domain-containing protein [Kitasatospora sp. NBC_01560]|uniref:DUF1697 domain-containing protein n=1 Tax=Kitasatospora sp. NBC_01560 TaxID=2975965 RepID=UPI003869369C
MTTTTTYIAFLRSINVGGRTVRMERLRGIFAELGLGNVRSYIQTGNVFFTADEDAADAAARAALTRRIEEHLAEALGYAVPTMLRTVDEVEALLAAEPFGGIEATPDVRLLVNFLTEPLPADFPVPYTSPDGDYQVVAADPGTAYVVIHLRDGRWNATRKLFGPSYRGLATARFLHTTVKILAAARKG